MSRYLVEWTYGSGDHRKGGARRAELPTRLSADVFAFSLRRRRPPAVGVTVTGPPEEAAPAPVAAPAPTPPPRADLGPLFGGRHG